MLRALERLLLPAECLECRTLLAAPHAEAVVCPVCRFGWRRVAPPWCERCGQPGPHFGACRLCASWTPALRRVRSAVLLDPGPRAATHALKYRGLARLAQDLADVMVRTLPPPEPGAALVPVPLGPRRLAARGFNQSERIAAALAVRWTVPMASGLLARVRDTPSQTALTPAARQANVAGVFCVTRGLPNPTFVLVDDVLTTGATLADAARALAQAGAAAVTAVTFARAAIPDFS